MLYQVHPAFFNTATRTMATLDSHNFKCVTNDIKALQGIAVNTSRITTNYDSITNGIIIR